ncbi:hypothetical protein ACGFZA_15765 [Streptomyces sp. NPDC048211]|uniref:hypothetical protein n=1 Tax=Streptomyces sp. NPDC048211 TaxID=3365516 RepID=UPI0037137084
MNITERKKIHKRFYPAVDYYADGHWHVATPPHPLDGRSVAEFVQEARAGWPKVPVPGDPRKAAQALAKKYSAGLDVSEWKS